MCAFTGEGANILKTSRSVVVVVVEEAGAGKRLLCMLNLLLSVSSE